MSSRWASDASDKVTSTPSPALSHRPNLRKPSPPPSLMSSKWAPTGANTKDDAHTDGIDQRSIMDEGAVKGAIMAMAGLVVGNP
jgi:hypothetical protein